MLKRLFLLLLLCPFLHAKVVIWDIGGVLTKLSVFGMAYQGGLISKSFWHAVCDIKNPAHAKKKFFSLLDEIEAAPVGFKLAVNGDGTAMPYLICQYEAGLKRSADILKQVYDYVDSLPQERFCSWREKEFIKSIAAVTFNPDIRTANTYLIPEGVALFKEVAQARESNNALKNRCIACSNWDAVSFHKLVTLQRDLFSLFERLEISGINHLLKPNGEVYRMILDKYKFKLEDCIFIDDQEVNTKAAESVGITSICLRNGNYNALRQELIRLGAL